MEEKLVPYEAVSIIAGRKVLVLAPHPDDEVFGCGGAIMRHVGHGDTVQVVVVSNGEYRADIEQQRDYGQARQNESNSAAVVMGCDGPVFWEIPDRSVEYGELLIGRIAQAMDALGADLVYAPSVHEMHPDHRAVGMAAVEAVRRCTAPPHLALYEIGIPMPRINTLLDITDVAERKHRAMACFVSQLVEQAYDQHIAALNRFRTYTLGKNVIAAEGYFVVSPDALARDFLGLYASEYERQRGVGLPLVPADVPLVSILIRSMGRTFLRDALDSVALQTYPNIEVVLIDAQLQGHLPLGEWCGRFPARTIDAGKALTRSQAANLALDSAQGALLLFLDDADWLAPDHIFNLVGAVTSNPRCGVAYAGTEFRSATRQPMELGILNEPFDAVRLRNEDYIPFQAVLFDRKFLAGGVRFDERLHVYEDWDFLLQLAQQTRFFHVDRVSAFCRASATPEADAGSDEVAKRQARGVVFDKWKAMGTGPQVDEPIDSHALAQRTLLQRQLAQLRNELDALHDQLREKNSELAGRLAQVTGLKNQCADQEVIINELRDKLVDSEHSARASNALVQEVFSSTSWAVARPIRWVGIRARTFKQSLKRWLSGNSLISLPTSALGVPSIVRRQDGTYELAHDEGRYTYVEPQQPPDMVDQLAKVSERTVFSIVVPVYNTPVALLEAAVRSVREQWYPNWRLILVDDASTSSDTSDALSRIDEPKIQLIRLGSNQGIAGATNAGLEAAKGDFIVFMDHDDELTPDCLYELALCIEREQGDFVYSDEDKLDESGNFTQPHFKPDWSPDTMMSTMFTGHVSCVRRSLLAAIGGLRSEFNGCQDWDFVLRVSELTQRISHVPKVLYHWRIIPASVASDIAAKPYVLDASRRVRMAALERRGLDGEIEPVTQVPGYFRVNYHLRGLPRISIIIPTRDGGNVLRVCIDSILAKSSYRNFEIVILDNGSTDSATIDYLQAINGTENIRVIRHDKPFNFSELNNIGAGQATGQLLLFLNDDAEVVSGDWMERMGGFALLPHVGAVGAKLIYPKTSTIQHAGVINLASGPAHAFSKGDAEMPGYFMRNLLEYNWLAVTGACMMIEKAKFDSLGGFDARFPIAYNDIELCIRAVNQGLFNVVCQAVTMIHHESISRGLDHKDLVKANRLQGELRRLFDKHPAYFQYDPFHNPNLDPEGLNFEVSM